MSEEETTSRLPDFLSNTVVKIIWIGLYIVLLLLSIFVFAPLSMAQSSADGYCFLYSGGHGYGSTSVCNYCIAIAVIAFLVSLVWSVILIIGMTPLSTKLPDALNNSVSLTGVHFVLVIIDFILLILILVMSSLISAGLSSMCHNLFGSREDCSRNHVKLPDGSVNDTFYNHLSFAEGSAWFLFCLWLFATLVEFFVLWRNGTLSELKGTIQGKRGDSSANTTGDTHNVKS